SLKLPRCVASAVFDQRANAASRAIWDRRLGANTSARRAPPICPAFRLSSVSSMTDSYAWHRRLCLTPILSVKHTWIMPSMAPTQERLPCQQAGEAFFVSARGSSSGQGRGDYTPETSVRTRLLAPSALVGPSLLEAAASPCHQPRDWAPRCQTVRNI